MSHATPKMRGFAQRLMAHDAKEGKSAGASPQKPFAVVEKLRPPLITMMGNAGYRALLSRSLALANDEVAWLRAIHVQGDGALEGMDELASKLSAKEITEGRVVLIAQVLGLLVAFVGVTLTVRIVQEIWPKLSLNNLDLE